jgi:hypothetical protein
MTVVTVVIDLELDGGDSVWAGEESLEVAAGSPQPSSTIATRDERDRRIP